MRACDRRQLFERVDDRDIIRRLVFEDAQFGRAIFRDRRVAIEMIGRKI